MYLVPDQIFKTTFFAASSNKGINTLLMAWEAVRAKPEGILGTQ